MLLLVVQFAVGGITAPQLNIEFEVTVIDANTFTIETAGTATSAATGGGTGITAGFRLILVPILLLQDMVGVQVHGVEEHGVELQFFQLLLMCVLSLWTILTTTLYLI